MPPAASPTRSTTTRCSTLLELAAPRHAPANGAGLRVRRRARPRRPPPARPDLPPGLVDLPAGPAHPQPATTPSLEARQWEADHFEDVPVHRRRLRARPPAAASRPIGAAAFYGASFPAVQNLLLGGRRARASAAPSTHAAAVVALGGPPDARAPRAGHAGRGRPARAGPAGVPRAPARSPPSATSSTSTGTGTSHFGPVRHRRVPARPPGADDAA